MRCVWVVWTLLAAELLRNALLAKTAAVSCVSVPSRSYLLQDFLSLTKHGVALPAVPEPSSKCR